MATTAPPAAFRARRAWRRRDLASATSRAVSRALATSERSGMLRTDRDSFSSTLTSTSTALPIDAEALQHLGCRPRLDLGCRQLVDDDQRAVLHLLGQRRAQRAELALSSAAGSRSCAAAVRRPCRLCATADFGFRSDARAAGALLPPRLLAAAADVRAVLRLVRAAAFGRVRVHDRRPNQVGLHPPAEHIVADVDAADSSRSVRSRHRAAWLLLALLRLLDLRDLDLLGGDRLAHDDVAASARPGCRLRQSSRWFSGSTRSTFRLCTVTRPPPIRPAARMPLTTREGNDDAPIEPGARWNIEPCVAAPPAK